MAFFPVAAVAAGLEVQPVTDGVWALVGEKEQRSADNLANNATFGVVVTNAGVVLVDAGGSWAGAAAIDAAIKGLTDQPVKLVINTGGQDHRWLGNGYWQAQGAQVIASDAAVADQHARVDVQMMGLTQFLGGALAGTAPVYATTMFETGYSFDLGGVTFEITHAGAGHTPGDAFVFVPAKDTVFTGDIVYVERILGVGEQSSILTWPEVFEAMAATGAAHVVPGHGHATDMNTARAQTYDYLLNLRAQVGALIEAGGDLGQAADVDQSGFAGLEQFDSLARKNAEMAFTQMEFE
ncbi:MBL fold metallo-hydrolase [Pseudorhodobacter sp. W20_MBD10_FR17]|uniref:MBL fold metallo-hydrolase n=1 Tax=Pseudorhodobacter sp. W20_MBD10_FR17 TaxID=3240266 RepID=UPI003F9C8E4C